MFRAIIGSPASRLTWSRRLALLFLIVYIAVLLAASHAIITNANHECIGDGCPICKLIHNAEMLLEGIGKATASVFATCLALLIIALFTVAAGLICNHSSTLINTKVRLNN